MLIHGQCHCGNLAFELRWEPDPAEIAARACTCAFCRRHGNVWASHPAGILRIKIKDATQLSRYAFGTRTAEFHVCACCGVVPLVTSRIDGRLYAVVNVNTFEGVDPGLLRHASSRLDGEGKGARLERRQRHWIADVRFAGDGD